MCFYADIRVAQNVMPITTQHRVSGVGYYGYDSYDYVDHVDYPTLIGFEVGIGW